MYDITNYVPPEIARKLSGILGVHMWRLMADSDGRSGRSTSENLYFALESDREEVGIAYWRLQPMPGCGGICISSSAEVHPAYRRMGLGTVLNRLRVYLASKLGYGCILCTSIESNIAQNRILEKNGWKVKARFINPKTGNTVHISVKNLYKLRKE